jgi:hypothetical protein
MTNNELRLDIERIMKSGFMAWEMPRDNYERNLIEKGLMDLFRNANQMKFIKRTGVLSPDQLEDVYNDIDMESEGVDDAREWAEYQEVNY